MSIVSVTTMQSLIVIVITEMMRKIMIWEAHDETCKNIEVAGEKILEIFEGWHIDKAIYPDKKWGKDMNSLIIEIRRDKPSCESCQFDKYGPNYSCDECSIKWEGYYKEG